MILGPIPTAMRRLVLLLFLFALPSSSVYGQTQLGVHYSALALEYPDQTRSGVGAFFVYAPRPWLGIDVATTLFLSEPIGGTAWQLLAGPRLGVQFRGLGIYGRVRPGLIRYADRFYAPQVVCIAIFPPPESCLAPATSFQLDLGGTVDVPLSSRTRLRFDVGDTLTRYEGNAVAAGSWTDALQFVAGVGWTF